MTRIRAMIIAAAVALIGVAGITLSTTAGADRAVTDSRLSEEEVAVITAEAKQSAPSSQRAALADDTVTEGEYLAAARRSLACVASAMRAATSSETVVTSGPTWSGDRSTLTYNYGRRAAPGQELGQSSDWSDVDRGCQREHLVSVQQVYLAGFQGSARMDAVAKSYRACTEEVGITLPDGDVRVATVDYLQRSGADKVPESLQSCLARYPSVLSEARRS